MGTTAPATIRKKGLGTLSVLSIGVGGMVGGGIFAVTGLTIQMTRGAAPTAFIVAGAVALLTAYSYLKLTLRYPGQGGTVEFLNRAFGTGLFTGSSNILLCLSYVVLMAIYAFAFGSYGANLISRSEYGLWKHTLITGIIILLAFINLVGARVVIRFENLFNLLKMLLLVAFIAAGLATHLDAARLSTAANVPFWGIVSGAMIIFLNYEGFELIANASPDIRNPEKSLPIAYLGGVLLVIVLYALIAVVVVGHLSFAAIATHSDYALSVAAQSFLGRGGFVMIVVAALLATSSAINATLYGAGRLTYVVAKTGELPAELERSLFHKHPEGMILYAVLCLLIDNFLPLQAIATMGSAGFLLIFMAVNLANVRLAGATRSRAWVSVLGTLACGVAMFALCWQVWQDPATRNQLWILAGMILVSIAIEAVYRGVTGREIHLGHQPEGC
ncbi:MAG TPA: APC family permease [Patescibacteria group bacterium]|nr:APC family permease [Patescibacteria group bacterium]